MKADLRLLLLPVLIWCAGLNALMPDSDFIPEIYSKSSSSLLSGNPNYSPDFFQDSPPGLSHPFSSLDTFQNSLKEAFSWGEPHSNLISYRHTPSAFKADVQFLAGYEHNFIEDQDYDFLYKGWQLQAAAGEKLRLFTHWYNGSYFGDLDAAETDCLADGYLKRFGKRIQLDNLNGYLSYGTQNYSLALGRGRFQISPAISSSIILSDRVNDYSYLLAEGRAGAFKLSMLHGGLMADSTYSIYENGLLDSRNYPEKYIALHQLSYTPNPHWKLYLGESVVYGNRALDLNYLLPNSFWRAVEHNLWDRDNVLIYAGLTHRPKPSLLLYATAALDEFSYGRFFSNWWGNKYALQGGVSLSSPANESTLELTAIRPYTYGHFQNHTMYSHDGRSLGYEQGANLFNLSLENSLKLRDYLDWTALLSFTYQGSEGADWRLNYHEVFAEQIDDAQVKWFAGDLSRIYGVTNTLRFSLFAHHKILVGHRSIYDDEWDHRAFCAWQFIY
ncbi:MAG: hypothetical protein PHO35_02670 [Candidatus Cloacimonetes bacterium]|nr:hypothetical protein [Candidatus Cloacimonadota bacterium]